MNCVNICIISSLVMVLVVLPPPPPLVLVSIVAGIRPGEAMTSQRLASMGGDPKNRLYINNCASIHNRFNKELLVDLVKLIPVQIQRDHKFNLYYIGISEADMDTHCYPNTIKQVLECTSIVSPTIMNHYKDIQLVITLLFVNKILILLMIY